MRENITNDRVARMGLEVMKWMVSWRDLTGRNDADSATVSLST